VSNRPKLRAVTTARPREDPLRESPFIETWLKEPGKLVTRRELYDFISRLERGRARANSLHRRIGWALQKAWRYLRRSPLDQDVPSKEE